MSEEEMNDNLLMLKYFLKTECDENWEDYCNAINKALNLISNLQKENEELKETLKCTQDSWFNDTQKLDKLQKENEELKEEVLDRKILMEQQQKELDKKDKVIEKTCRYINEAKIMNKAIPVYPNKVDTPYTVGVASIEEIKQYFYKKAEEEKC